MLAFQLHIVDWLFKQPTAVAPGADLSKEMLAKDIPLTLAVISGGIGAIVVVFILFGLQSLELDNFKEATQPDRLRLPVKKEIAAIRLLMSTSSVAMFVLLLTPMFLLYNVTTQALAPGDAVAIGLGSFSFSVTMLLVGLLAYFTVSSIRSKYLDNSLSVETP